MKRVVITGLGSITPLGNNQNDFWESIVAGKNGIDRLSAFDTTEYNVKLAAEVKDLDFSALSKRDLKFDSKHIHYARIAALEAYKDSKLEDTDFDKNRFAVYMSTSIGGMEKLEESIKDFAEKGPSKVSPFCIPSILPNMASGKIAIDLGAKGSNVVTATACASGANSIGEAYLKIKYGYENVALAGASEAAITPVAVAGFAAMRALSTETDINKASIPFDKNRTGFVIGEGSGVIIMEELEHALKRNAHIYAEIIGYGSNCDAYNVVSPDYEGLSSSMSILRALEDAGINPEDVDYINAHGTSTVLNDKTETQAINKVFKNDKPFVSSTKSMIGHLLAASGAVEAIVAIKSLEKGIITPTINTKEIDEECNLNIVLDKSIKKDINIAISNSFGFGGHNVCLVFKKWCE
ncbi:MAG: beta-ketoacyl-ACP synthase II [Bacilli bacterium]|nr:beta-ketoacyl-ACP synthase II [Bacilli bacterium]MDD4809225.1 beta-ketoacyl-ACP synthase II [Bacilli bacterium]